MTSSTATPLANPSDPCVHCGFCLPSCASYRVLGTEMDSPRGRIHALKAIAAGELALDATVAGHFDSCLGCFACVTACPSGVRYDQLLEATRPQLNAPELRSSGQTLLRRALFALLPYPQRLRAVLQALRGYARSPLQALVRRSGLLQLGGGSLAAMEQLLPELPKEAFHDAFPLVTPPLGARRYRVALVLGCVQRVFDPEVNAAAVRVLAANGIEVVIPPAQGCCGAVTHHQGETAQTQQLASELIESLESVLGPGKPAGTEPLDAVVVAASGCGHTMKAYGSILASQPAWAKRGSAFASQVFDIQEFLALVGLSESFQAGLRPLARPDGNRPGHPRSAPGPAGRHPPHPAARSDGGGRLLRQRRHLQPGPTHGSRRPGPDQGRRPLRHRRRLGGVGQHRLQPADPPTHGSRIAADPGGPPDAAAGLEL
jgi:glycolate oxidase iron-sulfur subunit